MGKKLTKKSPEKNQAKGVNSPMIKIIGWFKFPVFITEDHRVELLIQHEGMKGFGLYISILCRIYYKKSECITRDELLSIKEKGCTKDTLKKVAFNYGLFEIDENNHVTSAIDFKATNDEFSSIKPVNKNQSDGQSDGQSDDQSDDQSDGQSNGQSDDQSNGQSDCTPTPVRTYKDKDNDKKNDYHHSKKSDDDGDDDDGDDDGGDDVPSVYRSEPMPRVLMDPIQYIHSINLHSAWTEAVLQTLGKTNPILRKLVMEQWEETKRFFALHAQVQAKVATLLSENDVKRYFTNCLNNPTTASKLQEHLAAQRAKEQEKQLEDMCKLMEQES